ncbi:MAG TPA: DUF2169 domain-containing protein [Candidatus Sulfotelmatobacter sp.]|nr:DUF2169 domain-containing protein [Candidatus Sulfotelmatobacter sp.]
MELLNATGMQAGYTMGMKPDGRELLVAVVKGTFTIHRNQHEEPQLAAKQLPLVDADAFMGEPGFSAPIYEYDFAPLKPKCDVLLNGSAYAPQARSATRVRVSLEMGPISKSFDVVGNRLWVAGMLGTMPSEPEPFTVMPISYDKAFGGIDVTHPDPAKHRYYEQNHAGVGFHQQSGREFIDGTPLPNTEESGRPVMDARGSYRPMAFGPIGRAWKPRMELAGTYDQNWIDNIFPFLPSDFNELYYQAAPPDQQMDYPHGGEQVVLRNLTPEGYIAFRLPRINMPVVFYPKHGENKETNAVIDTIVFEPDLQRFTMTWRSHIPLQKNMFEIEQILVGEMPKSWYRARELGKTYYPSLGALAAEKRGAL